MIGHELIAKKTKTVRKNPNKYTKIETASPRKEPSFLFTFPINVYNNICSQKVHFPAEDGSHQKPPNSLEICAGEWVGRVREGMLKLSDIVMSDSN